ncbi:MAG: hypothetical protein IJX17_03270 [Clostridia bacterium]|nr:hypothetical protein [Clostridia bacterium]
MEKVEWLKGMAVATLGGIEKGINEEELDFLMSIAETQEERDLYISIYNYFLKKKSEEVIKNGWF